MTGQWSSTEVGLVVRAARCAPVYTSGRPWVLEPQGHQVSLYEVQHHSTRDRLGLDRLLSCGAALHNVHTALRAFGWRVEVVVPHDVSRPDLLAVLNADRRQVATAEEVRDYEAIEQRAAPGEVDLPALIAANHWPGTRLCAVRDGLLVLASGGGRQDGLRAGAAMQSARLAARALGMRTTPVLDRLLSAEGLPGHPWALLRVGTTVTKVVAGQ